MLLGSVDEHSITASQFGGEVASILAEAWQHSGERPMGPGSELLFASRPRFGTWGLNRGRSPTWLGGGESVAPQDRLVLWKTGPVDHLQWGGRKGGKFRDLWLGGQVLYSTRSV